MSAVNWLTNLFLILFLFKLSYTEEIKQQITTEERKQLREEARDMFYHAYYAYMDNAYPADELMPLSCKGRYRGLTPSRGDIDDCLGNFSLTLIDTLDTLVILGDLEEFEHGVKLVIESVTFDNDVIVSVFETNIRVLGGLLSAHILAEFVQQRTHNLQWYAGELLQMSKDLGYRLLPAFNTSTGIPYSRINLKYGLKTDRMETFRETCTACAGSMILEMAALSRLSGEPVFEQKAHKAMDALWKMRHRSSDLMGSVLNVHSGDWVRRDSGVGAGIDSYYEYCLKAYVLLGDEKYLNRFNRHYEAIMKYISNGPMLLDVHMHRPYTNSRNYMDALLAFWPGLQVLKGDIKPAVETHEMLYQVMQRHKFIPEAFTTDFQVHWGNHPLRPEFLESTYFLYKATNDPYYLEVGKNVLKSLQKYTRVPCGYAAVSDVRTGRQEDRMDSFVLAETFKYLFLLFADDSDLILNLDEFLFTTEGHLLPLTLAVRANWSSSFVDEEVDDREFSRTCPNILQLFPESVRKPLENMVDGVVPQKSTKRLLKAEEFSLHNLEHQKLIKEMGITFFPVGHGAVHFVHDVSTARSVAHAGQGLLFLEELSKINLLSAANPRMVKFTLENKETGEEETVILTAGLAEFNKVVDAHSVKLKAVKVEPFLACSEITNPELLKNKIAIVGRGECTFVEKARNVQKFGAAAGIVIDNVPGTSIANAPLFSMSGDGKNDVNIQFLFLLSKEGSKLLQALESNPDLIVTLGDMKLNAINEGLYIKEDSMFQKLKVSVLEFVQKHTGFDFTQSVSIGKFKAEIGASEMKITKNLSEPDYTVDKKIQKSHWWTDIIKELYDLIINSEKNEVYISTDILSIYEPEPTETKEVSDVVKKVEGILKDLNKEHVLRVNEVRDIINQSKGVAVDKTVKNNLPQKVKSYSSILETLSQLEKKITLFSENSDDLVVFKEQNSDKVINTEDKTSKNDEKSKSKTTKSDEL